MAALFSFMEGQDGRALALSDRGLAYGDGLFETMRVVNGAIPLHAFHLSRLESGLARLGFAEPARVLERFNRALEKALLEIGQLEHAVLKLIVTRGSSGRGYTPSKADHSEIIVQAFDFQPDASPYLLGIKTCAMRLAIQPRLAGLKHLNRLEQVLAAQELEPSSDQDQVFDEGLLFTCEDELIEGVKSNVLLLNPEGLVTPDVERAGVAGVMRSYLLSEHIPAALRPKVRRVTVTDVANAKAIAFCNSVRGIQVASHLDGKVLEDVEYFQPLQTLLSEQLGI